MPDDTNGGAPDTRRLYAQLFTEIGIIGQLTRAILENRLPDGLNERHFAVLNHLARLGDGQTPLKIASAFQVPKTSMTHTLSGLEGRGLIEVRPNPEDGRSKCVFLTAAGRVARDAAIADLGADIDVLAALVEADEIAELVPRLERLRKALDENRARFG